MATVLTNVKRTITLIKDEFLTGRGRRAQDLGAVMGSDLGADLGSPLRSALNLISDLLEDLL